MFLLQCRTTSVAFYFKFNTMADFSDAQIQAVWEKAKKIDGQDPSVYRKDYAGAIIQRNQYGKGANELDFGWTIDHAKPLSKGGPNDSSNLVALHWMNNNYKSDDYPEFKTIITSEDNRRNCKKEQSWLYKQS